MEINPTKSSKEQLLMYERVWDVADYVIPPSENSGFFVMTNAVITPNQTRKKCPEDYFEMPDVICKPSRLESTLTSSGNYGNATVKKCTKDRIRSHSSHGEETGNCVENDRWRKSDEGIQVCEISGWCPVEQDLLRMTKEPLIPNTENFTVLIKNTISFLFPPDTLRRDNMPNGACIFNPDNADTWLCPIFRLGDIVGLAGGIAFVEYFV